VHAALCWLQLGAKRQTTNDKRETREEKLEKLETRNGPAPQTSQRRTVRGAPKCRVRSGECAPLGCACALERHALAPVNAHLVFMVLLYGMDVLLSVGPLMLYSTIFHDIFHDISVALWLV